MSDKKVNKIALELLIITSTLFLLLLTAVNISNYHSSKRVLGIETQESSELIFWQDFLDDNPNYIPGWVEIGKIDKVETIDPNYYLIP
jgi:hypothetical protein